MSDDQRRSRAAQALPHRITVLGAFTLTVDGAPVALSVDARRLVAYLAVHPPPAGPRGARRRPLAGGGRRAAPRRCRRGRRRTGLLDETRSRRALAGADVEVDLAEAMRLIRGLPTMPADTPVDTTVLTADILPGWSAAWIEIERERFRQLRLYAIEERSQRLITAGRFDHAVAMAKVAVRTAPSRESARRALIEAYVAQGDLAAAVNEYDEYQELLRSSLGGPVGHGLDGLFPTAPAWPVLRARSMMPRSAVQLPGGVRAVRSGRRLVAGGSAPGNPR